MKFVAFLIEVFACKSFMRSYALFPDFAFFGLRFGALVISLVVGVALGAINNSVKYRKAVEKAATVRVEYISDIIGRWNTTRIAIPLENFRKASALNRL